MKHHSCVWCVVFCVVSFLLFTHHVCPAYGLAMAPPGGPPGATFPPANTPPSLTYSTEKGFYSDPTNKGVEPNSGTAELTRFTFKVVYIDPDNDPPLSLTAQISPVTTQTLFLTPDISLPSGSVLRDGNYANGEQFATKSTFPKGTYQFFFTATNQTAATRLPQSSTIAFTTGFSNVAFLPGIQASRLYRNESCGLPDVQIPCENQLWEPNRTADIEKLFLDETGTPIFSDIYTKDTIDEVNLLLGNDPTGVALSFNVYKKFIEFMNAEMKGTVIADWKELPYDWRLPLNKIIRDGRAGANGTVAFSDPSAAGSPFLISELSRLAATSDSGNVTIIAHSMGGLVAKELLAYLKTLSTETAKNLLNHIDQILFIATPHLGTPKALASLLHGDGQSMPPRAFGFPLGFIVGNATARAFGANLFSAYTLLPSREYFQHIDTNTQPIIEFAPEIISIPELSYRANTGITSYTDMRVFLNGDNGAWDATTAAEDVDIPAVLNQDALTYAEAAHTALDPESALWLPSSEHPGFAAIQLAGWGSDTVRGIRYDECETFLCTNTLSHLDRELLLSEDGDGTVVTPSATALPPSSSLKTFYFNILAHNRQGILNQRRNRSHADILETEEVQNIIQQSIQRTLHTDTLPTTITSEKPIPTDEDTRIRIRVKSPVAIDVYDTIGGHAGKTTDGVMESSIPNSSYMEIGEKKYLSLDTRDAYTVELAGTGLGTFTLEFERVYADIPRERAQFTSLPVTPSLRGTMALSNNLGAEPLALDVNGDGVTDIRIQPNESVSTAPALSVLQLTIPTLAMHKNIKKALLTELLVVERLSTLHLTKPAYTILRAIRKQIEHLPENLINKSEKQFLIGALAMLSI